MIDRRQARILAMQALCQFDVQGDKVKADLAGFLADSNTDAATIHCAHTLVETARREQELIDQEITRHCPGWSMERMAPVERNVMRVALAEIDLQQTPVNVIINEAIEIAREFGAAESAAFVNGVLDAVHKNRT